jgi:excinuclease UvrABC nuclease subunit
MATPRNSTPLFTLYDKRLPWITVTGRNCDVPELPGVYAVYDHGQLVYIGSSTNLRRRLRAYGRKRSSRFDRRGVEQWFSPGWSYEGPRATFFKVKMATKQGEWLMREWRLISRLKPCYNTEGAKRRVRKSYGGYV